MNEEKENPLYSLILSGGKSSRMHMEKSKLSFHGQPQVTYCYNLLSKFCEKVFVSCRKDQAFNGYPLIHDVEPYANIGPIGGIISAMTQYPEVDWIVIACDLPFMNEETIQFLIDHRNKDKLATAFVSTHDNMPEPLCALYEKAIYSELLYHYEEGLKCPRKILIKLDIQLIQQKIPRWLDNVNTTKEFEEAMDYLRKIQNGSDE